MRWPITDDEQPGGAGAKGAQDPLFDQPESDVVERRAGRGAFAGMEFLHVRARTIINSLGAASGLPFRHTVNAYRGCSHACSYCLAGETPVMLAGGGTRPIAELRTGDALVGTRGRTGARRLVTTEVLAHWRSVRPAHRVTLADGSAVVASGDHRFLTPGGWRHVTATDGSGEPRPHLRAGQCLVGVRHPGAGVDEGDEAADRRIRSIEALGVDLPMFDITTGTGDFVANGVVSHNCFARPSHEWLELDIDEGFERQVVVKVNAVERLRVELSPRRWAGDAIAMGTNTDPYQRCEGIYGLTRGLVEVLAEVANPFSILTKSTLVLRDLELLVEAGGRTDVSVNLSIGTLDPEVWQATEPSAPHPLRRVEAVARLRAAGVRCGVLVAPVLPGLSDGAAQLDAVVAACAEAGASNISGGQLVYLKPGTREVFLRHLARSHPHLVARYEQLYQGVYAPPELHRQVHRRLQDAIDRHRGRRVSIRRNRAPRSEPAMPAPPVPRRAPSTPPPTQLGLPL